MKKTAFTATGDVYVDHIKTNVKYSMNTQHYHETYEIYLQIEGTRYLFCDDVCYNMKRGDLIVVAPFNVHYARQGEGDSYERIVLNFDIDVLKSVLSDDEIFMIRKKLKPCIIHLNDEQTEMLKVLFMRIKHYKDKDGFLSSKMIHTAILQFVMSVIELSSDIELEHGERISNQIVDVITYINKNYSEDVTVELLAEIAHMSKNYFCRKFKDITGATVMEFLNNVRLTKVHGLLINSDMSIEHIADKTGFASSLNLLRAFKKAYGMTPREFRKKRLK